MSWLFPPFPCPNRCSIQRSVIRFSLVLNRCSLFLLWWVVWFITIQIQRKTWWPAWIVVTAPSLDAIRSVMYLCYVFSRIDLSTWQLERFAGEHSVHPTGVFQAAYSWTLCDGEKIWKAPLLWWAFYQLWTQQDPVDWALEVLWIWIQCSLPQLRGGHSSSIVISSFSR